LRLQLDVTARLNTEQTEGRVDNRTQSRSG